MDSIKSMKLAEDLYSIITTNWKLLTRLHEIWAGYPLEPFISELTAILLAVDEWERATGIGLTVKAGRGGRHFYVGNLVLTREGSGWWVRGKRSLGELLLVLPSLLDEYHGANALIREALLIEESITHTYNSLADLYENCPAHLLDQWKVILITCHGKYDNRAEKVEFIGRESSLVVGELFSISYTYKTEQWRVVEGSTTHNLEYEGVLLWLASREQQQE